MPDRAMSTSTAREQSAAITEEREADATELRRELPPSSLRGRLLGNRYLPESLLSSGPFGARYVADDSTKGFGTGEGFEWVRALASGSVGGVPMPFVVMCVVAAMAWVLLHRSVYGRHLFAVGHNAEAARYSPPAERAFTVE